MSEWILIVSMTLSTFGPDLRDISFDTVPGFSSEARCREGGKVIARSLMKHARQVRKTQGVSDKQTKQVGVPHVRTDCIKIEK